MSAPQRQTQTQECGQGQVEGVMGLKYLRPVLPEPLSSDETGSDCSVASLFFVCLFCFILLTSFYKFC